MKREISRESLGAIKRNNATILLLAFRQDYIKN